MSGFDLASFLLGLLVLPAAVVVYALVRATRAAHLTLLSACERRFGFAVTVSGRLWRRTDLALLDRAPLIYSEQTRGPLVTGHLFQWVRVKGETTPHKRVIRFAGIGFGDGPQIAVNVSQRLGPVEPGDTPVKPPAGAVEFRELLKPKKAVS